MRLAAEHPEDERYQSGEGQREALAEFTDNRLFPEIEEEDWREEDRLAADRFVEDCESFDLDGSG